MEQRHVLLVTFPAQGHINPTLHFAERLTQMGVEVTFATSLSARRRMEKTADGIPKGLNFAFFSDGFDDGFRLGDDHGKLKAALETSGAETIRDTIAAAREDGRPVTCLIHTLLLPWAAGVARELGVPVAVLWIQPASVLAIYYYYFNGFAGEISSNCDDPNWRLDLPGFPYSLSKRDVPSFLLPSGPDIFTLALQSFREQFEDLEKESDPKVLVNTFDALEPEILAAFGRYKLIGVGPLVPNLSDKSFRGDLFQNPDDDYLRWLTSQPQSSVVYVSFGSLLTLPKPQMGEIAKALLKTKRPFLWVIRSDSAAKEENKTPEAENQGLMEEEQLHSFGRIVSWCSQLEVLTHPSLGCFVTHCGWNSTLESLCCGVPTVAFPYWSDQGTNAKMVADVWKTGVRVRASDEKGVVESDEIGRCIEQVMDGGDAGRELRENARKWKVLAGQAMAEETGSSYRNLRELVGLGARISE